MSKSTVAPLNTDLPFARNFDVALRQAQDLRKRGELDQASRILAQLVLAAPDDPRVVGEYGKVMLETGQIGDAVAFLERAIDLQPADWTLSSALGVAYDQGGNRDAARAAFQRALTIKPGESTVLSNLALSHMKAGELDEAERLLLLASEQTKDVSGIAAKLAMVRNIRTTTAQSRPLAVSALPQPTVPAAESGSQTQSSPAISVETAPASFTPTPVEAAPVPAAEPVSQEPADEEETATIEEPETENVAIVPAPAPAVATKPIKSLSNNDIEVKAKVVPQKTAPIASVSPPVKAPAKTVIARRETPKPVSVQVPPRISISAQVLSTEPQMSTPAPAKPSVARAAPVVAAAPKADQPGTNPSPQSAVMTRRADVTNAVATRTAGAPLVLAPPRDSWESMVRVSLPPHPAALPLPADQKIAPEPPAESSGWSAIVTRWLSAALGFVTSLWA